MGVKAWITVRGQHIPIMDGESKMAAVGRFIKDRMERKRFKNAKSYGSKESIAELRKQAKASKDEWKRTPNIDDRDEHNLLTSWEKASIKAGKDQEDVDQALKYRRSLNRRIKGQNKFFKGAKVQVENTYTGEKQGEYRVKGKMDKDRSKMLYGSAVTGYDIEATGKFAEKLNKAGVDGKSQSNNYRMSLYPNKYKLKEDKKVIVPKSAMTAKTSAERRKNLASYFYDRPKGSQLKINGQTYTKTDNTPGGTWKRGKFEYFSEDLIKEFAHYREK